MTTDRDQARSRLERLRDQAELARRGEGTAVYSLLAERTEGAVREVFGLDSEEARDFRAIRKRLRPAQSEPSEIFRELRAQLERLVRQLDGETIVCNGRPVSARPLGDGRFEVSAVPADVSGLAVGDVIALGEDEERKLVTRSGSKIIRFYSSPAYEPLEERALDQIEALGCRYERDRDGMTLVHLPRTVDFRSVKALLRAAGIFEIEYAHREIRAQTTRRPSA